MFGVCAVSAAYVVMSCMYVCMGSDLSYFVNTPSSASVPNVQTRRRVGYKGNNILTVFKYANMSSFQCKPFNIERKDLLDFRTKGITRQNQSSLLLELTSTETRTRVIYVQLYVMTVEGVISPF